MKPGKREARGRERQAEQAHSETEKGQEKPVLES